MSADPRPISAEEYLSKRSKIITLTSGEAFKIRKMNSFAMVQLMGIVPSEGFVTNSDLMDFCKANIDVLSKLASGILIEPKLRPEDLDLTDVIELMAHMVEMVGLKDAEASKRDEFRKDSSPP